MNSSCLHILVSTLCAKWYPADYVNIKLGQHQFLFTWIYIACDWKVNIEKYNFCWCVKKYNISQDESKGTKSMASSDVGNFIAEYNFNYIQCPFPTCFAKGTS